MPSFDFVGSKHKCPFGVVGLADPDAAVLVPAFEEAAFAFAGAGVGVADAFWLYVLSKAKAVPA
jgi:hypothetical protein